MLQPEVARDVMRTTEVDISRNIAEKAKHFYNDENRWGRESLPEFKEQIDEWLQLLSVQHSGVVAELGCGRGAFRYLAARYCYIGLDISFRALSRYVAPSNAVQADIESLPVASRSVDFVLSVSTLEHVPHPEYALAEIHRILKPGGVVFLAPAWFCRPWAAKGLRIRRYRELGLADKLRKALIPLRNNLLWRSAFVIPSRLFREIQFRWSSGLWRFRYTRLSPNLTDYIDTDCDAFSSLDPHEAVLLFLRWGYEVPSASSFLRRLFLRHVPVVVRKPSSLGQQNDERRFDRKGGLT